MTPATPPGPSGLKLLTQLPAIQRDVLGFLTDSVRAYGDLVFFDVPRNPAYLLNRPELIQHVLLENYRNYTKDTIQYNSLREITGEGLLTSDSELWLRQRRLEQPAFARPRLAQLDQVVVPALGKMLASWDEPARSGEQIDVDDEMMRMALEVVGKALFSIDLSEQAAQLTGAVLTALDHLVHRLRNPVGLPGVVLTPRRARFQSAIATLDLTVYDLIASRRERANPGDDLLGMLLKARDPETGEPMSEQQVRDEVITILIAGHETVASALTWTWYLLAKHPAAWQRLHEEASSVLQGAAPTTADLSRLPFTRQVFDEALRLYPPAWIITRKALAADRLGEFETPPGALMIMSPYTIQRHPDFWDEPDAFRPERFDDEGSSRPRFAYIPFGGGPRLCIGNNFALIEAQLTLAAVAQRFRLALLPERPVEMDALVTLRPKHGLPMRVIKLS